MLIQQLLRIFLALCHNLLQGWTSVDNLMKILLSSLSFLYKNVYCYPSFVSGWAGQWCRETSVPRGPGNWVIVQQGQTVFVICVGGACLNIFSLSCHFSFSFSLGDGQRYIEIPIKGASNQPTNH